MSDYIVERGAWTASVGRQLPVTVHGRRIGTALVCDDGSLHVHVDDTEIARVILGGPADAVLSVRPSLQLVDTED